MQYFAAILKKTFQHVVRYKWDYIISLLIDPAIIFILVSLFKTIYSYDSRQIILGYTCTQMIWYFAAIKFFYSLVWCDPDRDIALDVLSGSMSVRLIQPITMMKITFTTAIAFRVSNFLFSFLPSFLLYTLFVYPDFLSAAAIIKYLATSVLAFILFYLISFFIGTAAFKLRSITTLQSIKMALVLMAGTYVPFDFLPGILQAIIKALPFQYIYYVPIQFFLNKPSTAAPSFFYATVFSQMIWIAVFYILSVVSWRIAVKRFYAVGG